MKNFYWSIDSETENGELYFFFVIIFNQNKLVKTCIDVQDEELISKLVSEMQYLSEDDENILLNLELYFDFERACDILTAYKFKQNIVCADEIRSCFLSKLKTVDITKHKEAYQSFISNLTTKEKINLKIKEKNGTSYTKITNDYTQVFREA